MNAAAAPLRGVRVLDLSWIGVGCIATWLLAELGAEVIKIEPTDGTDNLRSLAPKVDGVGINHLVFDRHKTSLPLDLRTELGRDAYLAVATTAHAVVEGMRTGVADRLGIGATALQKLNPALTYVTLPGYGSGGPLSGRAGHDLNFDALAGVLSMTWPGPVGPPPIQAGDYFGACLAALAVVSGVLQAQGANLGAQVESSLFDAAMFAMVIPQAQALMLNLDVQPQNHMLVGALACYSTYECADGQRIAVGALEPHFWRRFCEMADIDDDGAQFDPSAQVVLRERVAKAIAKKTRDQWIAHFGDEDVCVSAVLSIAEAVSQPHVRQRGRIVGVEHPSGATYDAPAAPLRFGGSATSRTARAPRLGEGARRVLLGVGYSAERIDTLMADGVVYAPGAGS